MQLKAKFKIAVLLATIFCATSKGYMHLRKFPHSSTNCYDKNEEDHAEDTEWYNQEKCEKLTCMRINDILQMSAVGCPSYDMNCETQVDLTAQYPDCCPQIISCPEPNEEYYDY